MRALSYMAIHTNPHYYRAWGRGSGARWGRRQEEKAVTAVI